MRPTPAASTWREALITGRDQVIQGMERVSLVETRDHHQEAQVIALVMREALEDPTKTAALVTPDRDLARRVISTLKRWGVEIDDSAGEPLIRRPLGSLCAALIDYTLSNFAIHELAKLLHHPLALFGWPEAKAERRSRSSIWCCCAMAVTGWRPGLSPRRWSARASRLEGDVHAHVTLKRLGDDDWALARDYALKIAASLAGLAESDAAQLPLGKHIGHSHDRPCDGCR